MFKVGDKQPLKIEKGTNRTAENSFSDSRNWTYKIFSIVHIFLYDVVWWLVWLLSANLFQITKGHWIFRLDLFWDKIYKIIYRGAPLSDAERKRLNLEAGTLIKSLGISITVTENKFDVLRDKNGYVGYANYYLQQCYDESELVNKADVTIYNQLLVIDLQLGTTHTEQLFECVYWSVRMDLIKV